MRSSSAEDSLQGARRSRRWITRPKLVSSRSLEDMTDWQAAEKHDRGLESDPEDDRPSRFTGSHDDLSKRPAEPSRSASFNQLRSDVARGEADTTTDAAATAAAAATPTSTATAAGSSDRFALESAPDSEDDVSIDGIATAPVSPRAESEGDRLSPLHMPESPRERRAYSDPTHALCTCLTEQLLCLK